MNDPQSFAERLNVLDWLKGCAIIAVILDHRLLVPQPFVVWSVNFFVLITAAVYSKPGHVFSGQKLFLKSLHLLYAIAFAVCFFDLLFALGAPQYNRALLPVLTNPYDFFIKNPYLGDIWYVSLHLQILFLFYFFFKLRPFFKPRSVVIASLLIAVICYLISHTLIHRFKTIFIGSWLIYIAAGFYGLLPLLTVIEKRPHNRYLWLLVSFLFLAVLYAGYSAIFPLAFTNRNRCSFMMLPLYFFLIIFLSEIFCILGASPTGKGIKYLGRLLGHHTLAIYLTHQAFATLWLQWGVQAPWLVALLSVGCGILFGILSDRLFVPLRTFAGSVTAELFPVPAVKMERAK